MSCGSPLILTLRMDRTAADHFNSLRQAHFPAELNYLPAHVTLFHHLVGTSLSALCEKLRQVCDHQPAIPVSVTGLRFLGRGVAYRLESPPLSALRRQLAKEWDAELTAQDRQPFQSHITVQNKVAPEEARRLYQRLQAQFQPMQIEGLGLDLWHYRGGPWEEAAQFPFIRPAATALRADESRSWRPD